MQCPLRHGRFGFLTLVFSGLAYVTDPNALPSWQSYICLDLLETERVVLRLLLAVLRFSPSSWPGFETTPVSVMMVSSQRALARTVHSHGGDQLRRYAVQVLNLVGFLWTSDPEVDRRAEN